jgi:predicted PurR-regulated permease PerM
MSRPRQDSTALNPLVTLVAVVLILYFARAVLIPLALALTLTFLLSPMVAWFQKLPMRRVPAVALATLISIAAVSGMTWVVGNELLQVANDLPKYRLNIRHKMDSLHYRPDSALGRAAESVEEISSDFSDATSQNPQINSSVSSSASQNKTAPSTASPLPVRVVQPPANGFQYLRALLGPTLAPLGMAGMVVIFTVFILIEQEDLRDRFLRLAGVAQLHAMTLALDDAGRRISRYLLMQILVNACYGVCFGVGLFLIGIPNAVLWGFIAGVFRIVPYAGVLSATAFPFVLALAVFNSWGPPLLVVLLFVMLELITSNLIEPWLYGAHTGISSLALLVTTVFWTMLWGWAGLVLAVPLTVCAIVLGRYVPRMSFLQVLLGDETALSSEAQFYQRLLALDQDAARIIADNFLKTHALARLYDDVFIPALSLAEQDRHKGAMDEKRESFFFLSVSEIVSELGAYRTEGMPEKSRKLKASWTFAAHNERLTSDAEPAASSIRIFCLPANDQADEIAASMLAQLLERNGYGVLALPLDAAFEEVLTHLSPETHDVICISALPPFAFAQARVLCQRIRLILPEINIVAGIWAFSGDMEKAKERFGNTPPDRVVTTLAQTLEQISQWNVAAMNAGQMSIPGIDSSQIPTK